MLRAASGVVCCIATVLLRFEILEESGFHIQGEQSFRPIPAMALVLCKMIVGLKGLRRFNSHLILMHDAGFCDFFVRLKC